MYLLGLPFSPFFKRTHSHVCACMCVSLCVRKSVRVCMQVCRAPRCMHSSCVTEHIMMNNSPKWLIVSCHCHKSHTHCPLQPPLNTQNTHTQNTHTHKLRPKKPHTNRTFVASYIPPSSRFFHSTSHPHIPTHTRTHSLTQTYNFLSDTLCKQGSSIGFSFWQRQERYENPDSREHQYTVPCIPMCAIVLSYERR